MYNSAEIIMSHDNKNMLIRRINDSHLSDKSALSTNALSRIISTANDSASFIEEIMRHPHSCVLLDLFLGDKDAVSFIREAKRKLGQRCPEFIVMCEFVSFRLERELYSAGASVVISRDTLPEKIWSVVCGTAGRVDSSRDNGSFRYDASIDPGELEIMVTDIMHKVGVPAHIKGYQYLRCAIINTVLRPEIINAVTKELYPGVAESFDTTPSRVERAIRHAIEVAWDRGDIDFLCAYFGSTIHNSRGKPTNSEFIAMIADKLRMTLRTAS